MRIGRYSEIEAGHQPRMFFAPEAGRNRLTLGKRIARWFWLVFRQLPRGRDRVEPGLPPELIGTGYKPPYFPPNKKRTRLMVQIRRDVQKNGWNNSQEQCSRKTKENQEVHHVLQNL